MNQERNRSGGGSARGWAKQPPFRQGYLDAQQSKVWTNYADEWDAVFYEAGRYLVAAMNLSDTPLPDWRKPNVPQAITRAIYSAAGRFGSGFVYGEFR